MQTFSQLNGWAAAIAAGALLIAADGALAKGNGGHDHGDSHSNNDQMKSHDSKSDHSDKHSDKNKDKSGEMRADKHKDKDSKRAEKKKEKDDDKHAEKTKDKDKDKTTTTTTSTTTTANGTTPAANGGKDDLFGKGIVGPNTNLKPVPSSAAPGAPAPGAVPGPTPINTIHPIPSPPAPGNGIVRVSDGKGNSVIIPDHGGGVAVTPAGPGKLTISNGVESRTVSGIALTISGARTVSVDKSLGVGRPPADGSTVVLTPNGTVTGGPPGGNVIDGILTAIDPPGYAGTDFTK